VSRYTPDQCGPEVKGLSESSCLANTEIRHIEQQQRLHIANFYLRYLS